MRHSTSSKNVEWLIEQSEGNKICTDPAFERPYGCWSKKQTNDFILALMSGMVSATCVLARIADCQEYSEKPNVEDRYKSSGAAWFSDKYSQGYRWVSLDSKHRRQAIVDFYNDKIALTGAYTDQYGKSHELKRAKFSSLSDVARSEFLGIGLNITEYTKATRTDLSKIFVSINSGAPLTDQQLRNPINTPFAQLLREEMDRRDTVGKFVQLYTDAKIAKMDPHKDFTKIYMHCCDTSQTISKKTMNDLYLEGESVGLNGNFSVVYDQSSWDLSNLIISGIEQISAATGVSPSPGDFILQVLALQKVFTNGYLVEDYQKFQDQISKLDDRLDKKSSVDYGNSKEYSKKTNFYFEWCRNNWGTGRSKRANKLWEKISLEGPTKYGLLSIDTVEVEDFEF